MGSAAFKAKTFFLFLNNQQHGPYTQNEIEVFRKNGQVTSDTMAWSESMTDWQPIATIIELNSITTTNDTSPPPISIRSLTAGDTHYEENVFPLLEAGKKSFNWWAFFFSPYWLAYKGLWKPWAAILIPYIALYDIVEASGLKPAALGFVMACFMGTKANQYYYDHYKKLKKSNSVLNKGSKLSGFGGICAFFIISAISMTFFESFVPAFKASFNESYEQAKNK